MFIQNGGQVNRLGEDKRDSGRTATFYRVENALIIDLDSTEDPVHGKQAGMAYNGHFAKTVSIPSSVLSIDRDDFAAKPRPGNVHSADGALEFITPLARRPRGLSRSSSPNFSVVGSWL